MLKCVSNSKIHAKQGKLIQYGFENQHQRSCFYNYVC